MNGVPGSATLPDFIRIKKGSNGRWQLNVTYLVIAIVMVLLNGFFVAAEFVLVKIRGNQLDEMVRQCRPFAKTASWLGQRMDASLSACSIRS